MFVLSVTILETTKTGWTMRINGSQFYRSQFWRLQKQARDNGIEDLGFIGHNFGDYKNKSSIKLSIKKVLSVTILETTKTSCKRHRQRNQFYRSQFWRLQKLVKKSSMLSLGFIGHNFGDYKNHLCA